ncbi:hypothetical protein QFC21_004970 [Naganishia friedmannii]|uniref:Uncharacterized protein n=1 Tax=Naganishia friedmannii TaxID=89922 RepID=A0ACC2VFC2_9TREE|nr:hypothetical protein QFC21_004970 [Naganishia friedmannii]
MPYAEPSSPGSSSLGSPRQGSSPTRHVSLPSFSQASEAIDGLPPLSTSQAAASPVISPSSSRTPTPSRSRSHSFATGGYVDYKFNDGPTQVAPVLPRRSSHVSPPNSNRPSRHVSPAMSPAVTNEHYSFGTTLAGITGLPRRTSSHGRPALPTVATHNVARAAKDSNASSASSSSSTTLVNAPETSSMDRVSDSLTKYAARVQEQEEREEAERTLKRNLRQQRVQRQLAARARELEQTDDFFARSDSQNSALTSTSSSEGEGDEEANTESSLPTPKHLYDGSPVPFPSTGDLTVSADATPMGSASATPTMTSPTGPMPLACPEAMPTTKRAPVINPRHRARDGPSLGLRRQPSSSLQLNIPPTPPIHNSMSTPTSITSPTGSTASSSAYLYDMDRPTSSFLRKKSGEVVKPSLKRRSLSTPHLPLRTESGYTKSEPATPGINDDYTDHQHKNVRFAGSDDGQEKLENVVLFLSQQKVTAVSKTADEEDGAYPVTETETEADTDATEYIAFRTRRAQEAKEIDNSERVSFAEGTSMVPRLRTDFSPSGHNDLKPCNVILERVELPSNLTEPLALRGSVLVRNLMFQKWVTIRFTMDNWQTVSEVAATHVVHIPSQTTGDEGWDRFTFSIKLEDFRRKIDEKQVLLCIRFSVDGNEWWDSNDGNNYRFAFKKVQPVKRRTRMFDLTQPESPTGPRSPTAAAPLPGTRGSNFGRMTGWNFPGMGNPDASPSQGLLGQPNAVSPQAQRVSLPRRTSDTNRHPPSFAAPPQPDVHEHLKLKTYCAPAPPLSPPKEPVATLIQHKEAVRRPPLSQVIGGQYASLPPVEAASHERRRSWGGEIIEDEAKPAKKDSSWTSQPESRSKALSPPLPSKPNDISAVVPKPELADTSTLPSAQQGFQQEDAKLADLNRAVNELSLFTPPSSALSSPPAIDPESETASTSSPSPASSTGELQHEGVDLPEVLVDPLDRDDEMEAAASGSDGIHSDSYQDFIKKYCFFSSYSSQTVSPAHSRSHTPLGGFRQNGSSPNPYGPDYPTFQPRDQITPTGIHSVGQHASSDNYFGFQPSSSARYSSEKNSSITGWAGALRAGAGPGSDSNNSSGGTTTPYLEANV